MDLSVHNYTPSPAIVVQAMPQLLGAQHSRDDWTGVTSTAERRKRQNHLHQRTYRRRRQPRLAHLSVLQDDFIHTASEAEGHGRQGREDSEHDATASAVPPEGYLIMPTAQSRAEVQSFATKLHQEYSWGVPQPRHLHPLIKLNVLNAMAYNAVLLGFGFIGLCQTELVSPFNQQGPSRPYTSTPPPSYPVWLRPTALQLTVRHHPWIDLIPIPCMRDNFLLAHQAGLVDNVELGLDVLGVLDGQGRTASLIVWGEPWDPRGWEASVLFLRKWGWLVADSHVFLEATNHWRHKRGEKLLDF